MSGGMNEPMARFVNIVVAIALVLAAWSFVRFSALVYVGRCPILPNAITSLDTFNDCVGFARDKTNCRLFRFVGGGKEAYLRFKLQDIDPAMYRLELKLRGKPSLLASAWCKSAKGLPKIEKEIAGDVCELRIGMNDVSKFRYTNGKTYVGVGFRISDLRLGDTVELLDFKFSLR